MSKLKIVLADDHPIVRMGVCDMLERDPRFEVVGEASNPSELVSLYRQADPHIAITDYSMPGDERYGNYSSLTPPLSPVSTRKSLIWP